MTDIAALRAQIRALKEEATGAKGELKELDRFAERYVALTTKLGIDPHVERGIRQMMRIKIAMETLYRSAMMLYAASGPLGWAMAAAGFAMGGIMLAGNMESRRPRY